MEFHERAGAYVMMNEIKELFSTNWQNLLIGLLCLLTLWDKLITYKDKIYKRYGIRTNATTEAEMIQTHDEQISTFGTQLTTINDKINVLTKAMVELQEIVSRNYDDNRKEHEEFREEKRKDQLSIIGDRLFQAYNYYKARAEREGCFEWTCVEKAGFYAIMDNYHANGGDTYSHSIIEPYMRQFKVLDPENFNPNDIYFDR